MSKWQNKTRWNLYIFDISIFHNRKTIKDIQQRNYCYLVIIVNVQINPMFHERDGFTLNLPYRTFNPEQDKSV